MKKIIIGVSGKAESGKNAFADMIMRYRPSSLIAVNFAFADEVKKIAKDMGWDGQKTENGRSGLIMIGDGARKYFDPDIWVKKLCKTMEPIASQSDTLSSITHFVMIVTDCRYPNEPESLREFANKVGASYFTLRVNRPNYESKLTAEQRSNLSETGLDDYPKFDFIIENDGTLFDFKDKSWDVMNKIISIV